MQKKKLAFFAPEGYTVRSWFEIFPVKTSLSVNKMRDPGNEVGSLVMMRRKLRKNVFSL